MSGEDMNVCAHVEPALTCLPAGGSFASLSHSRGDTQAHSLPLSVLAVSMAYARMYESVSGSMA